MQLYILNDFGYMTNFAIQDPVRLGAHFPNEGYFCA